MPSLVDVKEILTERRTQVLAGCNLVFSGIFPLQLDQAKLPHTRIWKTTLSFGAHCGPEVDATTTHLIAAKPGTQKAARAAALGARVVHLGWLRDCIKYYMKLDEEPYLLMPHTPVASAPAAPPLLQDLPELPPSPPPPPPPDDDDDIYIPSEPLTPPESPPSPPSPPPSTVPQQTAPSPYPPYTMPQYPGSAYQYPAYPPSQYPPPAAPAPTPPANPFAGLPASVLWSMMNTLTAARNYWATNPHPQAQTPASPYVRSTYYNTEGSEKNTYGGYGEYNSRKAHREKSNATQGIPIASLAATAAVLAARMNAAAAATSSSSSSTTSSSSSSSTSTTTDTANTTNSNNNNYNNNFHNKNKFYNKNNNSFQPPPT